MRGLQLGDPEVQHDGLFDPEVHLPLAIDLGGNSDLTLVEKFDRPFDGPDGSVEEAQVGVGRQDDFLIVRQLRHETSTSTACSHSSRVGTSASRR